MVASSTENVEYNAIVMIVIIAVMLLLPMIVPGNHGWTALVLAHKCFEE